VPTGHSRQQTQTRWPDFFSSHRVSGLVQLLIDAKLIEGSVTRLIGAPVARIAINRLTWAGHDFVQASRDNNVWNKAKDKIKSTSSSVSFELLLELLKALGRAQLGL
jgi:hypothetical protein